MSDRYTVQVTGRSHNVDSREITITVTGEWPGTNPITDCLNKHMPKPKKTLEDFLAMSDGELSKLAAIARSMQGGDYAVSVGAYYNFLRPELKELGYYIDVRANGSGNSVVFSLFNGPDIVADITESSTNTPARIYTILYLLAKEL